MFRKHLGASDVITLTASAFSTRKAPELCLNPIQPKDDPYTIRKAELKRERKRAKRLLCKN